MKTDIPKLTRKQAGAIGGRIIAIKRRKESIEKYMINPNKCLFCGLPIIPKERQKVSYVRAKKFCNPSCAAQKNNPKRKIKNSCIKCGAILNKGKIYCSGKRE